MSFGALAATVCQRLQTDYIDYFGKNSQKFKTGGSTALIKYLLSPENTKGYKKINVESIPGKKRGVAFQVDLASCLTGCTPAVTCNTVMGSVNNNTQELVYDLTGNAFRICNGSGDPLVLKFTRDELKKYCTKDDMSYIKNKIIDHLVNFEEAFNKVLNTLLLPQAGTNHNGDALTVLPFFVKNTATNTEAVNPDAIFWLDQNYSDIQGVGQYALFGGKMINKLTTYLKWQSLSQSGIDVSKTGDLTPYPYYDRTFDGIVGNSKTFLQLSPGAVQLVTFNENKGAWAREVSDLYSNGTIISPTTGLEIDWKWRFDYNCEAWTFDPYIFFDLAVNKAGGCGPLDTTNGIIKYEDCVGTTVPVCPVA